MIFEWKRRRNIKICQYQYIPSWKYQLATLKVNHDNHRIMEGNSLWDQKQSPVETLNKLKNF